MSRKDTSPRSRSSVLVIRRLAALGAASIMLAMGCAKVSTPAGAAGSGGAGVRGTGTGGAVGPGTGGAIGRGEGDAGLINPDTGQAICQEGNYKSVPQIPTVFILVDQSGSMFKCRTNGGQMTATECVNHADTSWYPLRDGVLTVVSQLQDQVRFGFAAFTGEQGDAVCPVLTPVAPAMNNHAAIAASYNGLVAPRKGETPTRKALEQIATLLKADTASAGEKFILFITDGEPDYCDDGNSLCAPDSVVGELQVLKAAGVKTLVMGISSPLTTISDAVLQAFANAGASQPVLPPFPPGNSFDLNAFWDQCNFVAGWKADFATTGKVGMHQNNGTGPFSTIGDYVLTGGGAATVYKPDVSNQTALVNEISRALSGVKSCTFDLNNLNGKMLKVDLNMLGQVTVKVMGTAVPLDMTNGWRMNSASELELVGSACSNWRMPQNMNIDIQIPCAAIVIE